MNIFGFLATICICGTVIGALWLLNKKPISIKIIRATEAPKPIVSTTEVPEDVKKADAAPVVSAKEPEQKAIAMDAVIKEVNALMGISTIEGDK